MTWMPKNPAPAPIVFQIKDLYLKSNNKLADSTRSLCFSLFWTYKCCSLVISSFEKALRFLSDSYPSDDESSIFFSCYIFSADISYSNS